MLPACSEPILRASHHEFKASKEWILATLEETELPKPTHPLAFSVLQQFAHLFPEEIPTDYLLHEISNTKST